MPLADVLASCDIKKENASYFLSPKCIANMHILGDVEEVFMEKFIRRLDGDNSVIIDAFHESENAVAALNNIKMMLLNAYLATEFFELIIIVVSISPGTGPLERSYANLERICEKERNNLGARSIQNLWLLAIYQLKDDEVLFDGVRKFGPLIMKK